VPRGLAFEGAAFAEATRTTTAAGTTAGATAAGTPAGAAAAGTTAALTAAIVTAAATLTGALGPRVPLDEEVVVADLLGLARGGLALVRGHDPDATHVFDAPADDVQRLDQTGEAITGDRERGADGLRARIGASLGSGGGVRRFRGNAFGRLGSGSSVGRLCGGGVGRLRGNAFRRFGRGGSGGRGDNGAACLEGVAQHSAGELGDRLHLGPFSGNSPPLLLDGAPGVKGGAEISARYARFFATMRPDAFPRSVAAAPRDALAPRRPPVQRVAVLARSRAPQDAQRRRDRCAMNVVDLGRGFRDRSDDPVSALDRALAAAARGAEDRAILTFCPAAQAEAEASRARFRGNAPRGPLDGVPLVVKDCIDIAGLPTSNGMRGPVPAAETDATLVARLRAAGAVVFAKTNMHELGILPFGINPHHGTPRNPWDPARMPGGSSAGSAVAVATGIAAAAIGTDAGGSIRVPACFNGLVGLKPAYGVVPDDGVAKLTDDLDHTGPIGWTVEDVTLVYEAIAARTVARDTPIGKVAILEDFFLGADAAVADAVRVAIAAVFPDAGTVSTPACRHATAVESVLVGTDASRRFPRERRAPLGPDARFILALGEGFTAEDRRRADAKRAEMRAEIAAAFTRADVLVSPMASGLAPVMHPGDRGGVVEVGLVARVAGISFVANLTGTPSVTVPCFRGEHPIGMQILARDEATALAAARRVEAQFGPRRPPRWHGT
jgi:aspartyl-tRNA(Asn)/glutamyl-tRNA(Gln) amidotransferase subunit A